MRSWSGSLTFIVILMADLPLSPLSVEAVNHGFIRVKGEEQKITKISYKGSREHGGNNCSRGSATLW